MDPVSGRAAGAVKDRLEGIPVEPVIVGFCGTDHELMLMGRRGQLGPKFPAGTDRLINGHEGVVWVQSLNRFAIVLIRGVDSIDPTRYAEDKSYFEYGCDQTDGRLQTSALQEQYTIFLKILKCF